MNNVEVQITLAKYIYNHPSTKNMDVVDIYDGWRKEYSGNILEPVFMYDILNIIDGLKTMDRELLRDSIDYDEKEILPRVTNQN